MNHQLWRSFTVAVVISGTSSYSCMASAYEEHSNPDMDRLAAKLTSAEVANRVDWQWDGDRANPPSDDAVLLVNWDASQEATTGTLEELPAEGLEDDVSEAERPDAEDPADASDGSSAEDERTDRQAYVPATAIPKPELPAFVFHEQGWASWYGPGFEGNLTANGEIFNSRQITAAHPYLPFGTQVRVTNHNNGRSLVVRINDRGPYIGGRIIDLSAGAAEELGMIQNGVAPVTLEILASSTALSGESDPAQK